jgi:hypothetical protein
MPYAQGRVFNDANSHIVETLDWLAGYADPSVEVALVDSISPAASEPRTWRGESPACSTSGAPIRRRLSGRSRFGSARKVSVILDARRATSP